MSPETEAMSIVVPVKNRATLVLKTLQSIKTQTWRPLKVIIVDNGSTDGTAASVSDWMAANESEDFEVQLIEEERPGAAVARNSGLEAVDTRLMMFFDSDDLMRPDHVETVMRRFYAGDDPDLVCFRVVYHSLGGGERITKRAGRDMMLTHLCHSLMRTQGYACETALARRVGGWDETTRGWDDYEFGIRLLLEARKRVYIPDVNVDVFAQIDSITGTEFSSRRGEWERVLDKAENNIMKSHNRHREKWGRIVSYRRVILAAHYKREKNDEAARELLRLALSSPLLSRIQRVYLRLAYHYAAVGGRGAAIPARYIL